MEIWRLVADRKIEEAMAEGAFDHLVGMGRPLHIYNDPFEDPLVGIVRRMLEQQGFTAADLRQGTR